MLAMTWQVGRCPLGTGTKHAGIQGGGGEQALGAGAGVLVPI